MPVLVGSAEPARAPARNGNDTQIVISEPSPLCRAFPGGCALNPAHCGAGHIPGAAWEPPRRAFENGLAVSALSLLSVSEEAARTPQVPALVLPPRGAERQPGRPAVNSWYCCRLKCVEHRSLPRQEGSLTMPSKGLMEGGSLTEHFGSGNGACDELKR